MGDFRALDSSPASILNYLTSCELSNSVVIGTNHLLDNMLIEDETILSKNTDESLSKVMAGLSLLRSGYCVPKKNMVILSESIEFPLKTDERGPSINSGYRQYQYQSVDINEVQKFHEGSDLSPIFDYYNEDDIMGNSILEIESVLDLSFNANKLHSERKYISLENFEEFSVTNKNDTKTVDQSLTLTDDTIDIIGIQNDSAMNSLFFENSKIFPSPIMNQSYSKKLSSLLDSLGPSPDNYMNNADNELDSVKKHILRNKLKLNNAKLSLLLAKYQAGLEHGSMVNLHDNACLNHNITTDQISIDKLNKSNYDKFFNKHKIIWANDKISKNESSLNILKNDTNNSLDKKYNIKDKNKKKFDEYFKEMSSYINSMNDSKVYSSTANELGNDCLNQTNDIPDVKNIFKLQKNINESTKSTQVFENRSPINIGGDSYHEKCTPNSLENDINLLLNQDENFLINSSKNFDRSNKFNQNIDNEHSDKPKLIRRRIDQPEDFQNVWENMLEAIGKVENIENIDTTRIKNLSTTKKSNVFSSKNFSTCSKIKFNRTDLKGLADIINKKQITRLNNKYLHGETNGKDKLINVAKSIEIVQDSLGRVATGLKKQHNILPDVNLKLLPFQQIKCENLRNLFHLLTSKKGKSNKIPNKLIKKKTKKNVEVEPSQEVDSIKFRLRNNTEKIKLEKPAPKLEQHVNIKKLRKFLISKLPRTSKAHVLTECEEIIYKINIAINTACSKKTKPINILSKLKKDLYDYGICENVIEFYTFVMNFTPFFFQKKILPLKGLFGCIGTSVDKQCKCSQPLVNT